MYTQRSDGRQVKLMILLAVVLLMWPLLATVVGNLNPGNCSTPLRITVGNEEFWVKGGGRNIQYQLDPDDAGSATGVLVDVYVCTENGNDNTCSPYAWDSTGDGTLDTNTLDGITTGRRGNQAIGIAGYLKFVATSATASKTAQLVVCATN